MKMKRVRWLLRGFLIWFARTQLLMLPGLVFYSVLWLLGLNETLATTLSLFLTAAFVFEVRGEL